MYTKGKISPLWLPSETSKVYVKMQYGQQFIIIHYTLGCWYLKQELGNRTAVFAASGPVDVTISGLIQDGLQKNTVDGRVDLSGWRWLFIISAVVTIPIAVFGCFIVPDSPETAKPRFCLSLDDIYYCRERIKVNGVEHNDKLDLSALKRVFCSYQWYLFCRIWIIWSFSGPLSTSYVGIVLQNLGYDVYNRNNIPTGISGVGITTALIAGFYVDAVGKSIEAALILTAFRIMCARLRTFVVVH